MLDARVVDQNIANARLFDQRAALVGLGHVGLDVACFHAEFLAKLFCQRVVFVVICEGVQDDVGTGFGKFSGHAQTDARIGTGNNRCFS